MRCAQAPALLQQAVDPRVHEVQVKLALAHLAQVARGALVERDTRDGRVVLGRAAARTEEVCARARGVPSGPSMVFS